MPRSTEIPDCIKAIEPLYITISVMPYSMDRVFLPNGEALEDFKVDITSKLHRFQIVSNMSPQVLIYNFEGIISIESVNTKAGMRYIIMNLRSQREESRIQTYSIFDGLSAESTDSLCLWEKFRNILQGIALAKPVVIARKQGRNNYNLLGCEEKVSRFSEIWKRLLDEQAWIKGKEFSREYPNPTASITLQDMNDLYGNGLALHANYRGISYFRSIV